MPICYSVPKLTPARTILLSIAVILAATVWPGALAHAADRTATTRKPPSACVGLAEGACATHSACTWRQAATTKKGTTIRAHCRKRPARSGTARPRSACAGLDLAKCGAKSECTWYRQSKTRKGIIRRAHCRKKPTRAAGKASAT